MKLNIKFGINFELKRVKSTLAKLDWYTSQGYKPRLPEGINSSSSVKEIKNKITEEFDEIKYKQVADKILSDFSKINKELSKKIKETFNKKIPTSFVIYLTNYGTGGSYESSNIVIFNLNSKKGYKTIIHEIIHLIIEPWIQEYKIQHWEKERIVDLILNSKEFNFLEYNSWQLNYHDSEKDIDSLFNSYFFKNSKTFFSKIEHGRA
jgi:hypothetical protein